MSFANGGQVDADEGMLVPRGCDYRMPLPEGCGSPMVGGYGSVILRRDGDRLVVDQADETIGVTAELLAMHGSAGITTDAAGALVIAGQVRYTPVRFDAGGRVVVCQRVDA